MGKASTAWSGGFSANQSAAENTASVTADKTAENMEDAGPGWYYDPDDQAIYRYWNGEAWTEHRSDTVLSEVPA